MISPRLIPVLIASTTMVDRYGSTIKKEGKTTLNELVLIWVAFTQDAPNLVKVFGNDLDQSVVLFRGAARIIKNNPELAASARIETKRILLSNGTEVRACTVDDTGEAGTNHAGTNWDELWGIRSERARCGKSRYVDLWIGPRRRHRFQNRVCAAAFRRR
jgi:hypothetical protein